MTMIKRMTTEDAAELVADMAGRATTADGEFHAGCARLVLLKALTLQIVTEDSLRDVFIDLRTAEACRLEYDDEGWIYWLDQATRSIMHYFTEAETEAGYYYDQARHRP